MTLDKAIKSGKEWRKPYKKAKAVSGICRNHGVCEHCKEARLYRIAKKDKATKEEMKNNGIERHFT